MPGYSHKHMCVCVPAFLPTPLTDPSTRLCATEVGPARGGKDAEGLGRKLLPSRHCCVILVSLVEGLGRKLLHSTKTAALTAEKQQETEQTHKEKREQPKQQRTTPTRETPTTPATIPSPAMM